MLKQPLFLPACLHVSCMCHCETSGIQKSREKKKKVIFRQLFILAHLKSGHIFLLTFKIWRSVLFMINALDSSFIWRGSMKNCSYKNINKVPFA